MLDSRQFAAQVQQRLESLSSPERRDGMSRYFTTSMSCMGVTVPQIRALAREISREVAGAPRGFILDLSRRLIESHRMETRQVAYEVICRHGPTMEALSRRELESLGAGNDNWGSVDAFATLITGVLWLRQVIDEATIESWARSESVWWRRTAIVSTVPLNLRSKGGRGDFERTVRVVDLVKAERQAMIAKAVSWALRALVPWEPDRVRAYLEANSQVLPALVRRQVGRKLDTGRKNPSSAP